MYNSYTLNNLLLEKEEINISAIMKLHPSIPNNHLLRNPVVNMLPKILPATSNSKTSSKIDNSTKQSSKFNNNDDKKVFDNNIQNEMHKRKTAVYKTHADVCSLKVNASDVKSTEIDKLLDKNDTKLSSILTRSSKISKELSQMSESPQSPQIRKTTPRLAKTRSAQNMKLMAQTSSSKNSSNCGTLKSKEKDTDKNIDERSSTSKVVSFCLKNKY